MKKVILSNLLLGWIHSSEISTPPQEATVSQLHANILQQGKFLVIVIQKNVIFDSLKKQLIFCFEDYHLNYPFYIGNREY